MSKSTLKGVLSLLVIRELQIKITLKYNWLPSIIAKILKQNKMQVI